MLSTSASQVTSGCMSSTTVAFCPTVTWVRSVSLKLASNQGLRDRRPSQNSDVLRLDLLAELELEIDHDAGPRRLDLGVGEIERRTIAQRQLLADRGKFVGLRLSGLPPAPPRRGRCADAAPRRDPALPALRCWFARASRLKSPRVPDQIARPLGLRLQERQLVLGLPGFSPDLAQARLELLDGSACGIDIGLGLGQRER